MARKRKKLKVNRNNGVWGIGIQAHFGELMDQLSKSGNAMADRTVPLIRIAEYLAGQSKDSFAGEQRNDGRAWPKRRGEGTRALLVLSGKLKSIVTSKTKGVILMRRDRVIFGVRKMPRALAHNFGRKKIVKNNKIISNVPPREFIAFEDETRDAIVDIVSDWQRGVITRANLRVKAA